jgi:hypothetical protein
MGGRGSASGLVTPGPAQTTPQPQVDSNGFSDTDNAGFHDLYNGRAYYSQQNLDIDTRTALDDYLDPNALSGSLYNFSQNMNYAVVQGNQLNAQQRFAYDSLVGSMHNLGYNVNLTRYDHGSFLDDRLASVGITGGHTGLSVAQLKAALVGQTYTDPRILSTSYNNFKNAADPSTFTTREVKITYRAKASTQALMPGDGPGGKFGEMLLAPSGTNGAHNSYHIVDVIDTGQKARPKGGSKSSLTLPQIEVIVEVG